MKREKKPLRRTVPSWFKITNYNKVHKLNTFGWFAQISIRHICWNELKSHGVEADVYDRKMIQDALRSLRANPIATLGQSPFDQQPFSLWLEPQDVSMVRSLTWWDLFNAWLSLRRRLTWTQLKNISWLTHN